MAFGDYSGGRCLITLHNKHGLSVGELCSIGRNMTAVRDNPDPIGLVVAADGLEACTVCVQGICKYPCDWAAGSYLSTCGNIALGRSSVRYLGCGLVKIS